jgi:hypothetical protein
VEGDVVRHALLFLTRDELGLIGPLAVLAREDAVGRLHAACRVNSSAQAPFAPIGKLTMMTSARRGLSGSSQPERKCFLADSWKTGADREAKGEGRQSSRRTCAGHKGDVALCTVRDRFFELRSSSSFH